MKRNNGEKEINELVKNERIGRQNKRNEIHNKIQQKLKKHEKIIKICYSLLSFQLVKGKAAGMSE